MDVILVVDDDATSVKLLRLALERKGYRVVGLYTPEDAIARCLDPDQKMDLLIADVIMPGLSGTHMAVQIREACASLPILFISGTPLEGWTAEDLKNARALLHEPVDFLQKPFTVDALFVKVDNLLKARGSVEHFAAMVSAAEAFQQHRSDSQA